MKYHCKGAFLRLLGMLLAALAAGIFGSSAVNSDGTVYAEEKQEFIVGFDAEFAPYGYRDDNGDYVGFDLDLAQEVCDRQGWTLVKRPISWDSKDSELKSGSISCIWNGFTMTGREDKYTWSLPYVDNSQVVIVKKGSDITKLEDLAGKILVVQSDSSALAALTGEDATDENKKIAASLKELQQVSDYNSAFMNLESGMVDAVAMDIGVASYQISHKEDAFVMLDEKLSSEKYGIGFKKGNTELRDAVQSSLLEMLEDGTFEKIAEKWGLEESVCLSAEDVDSQIEAETSAAAGAQETTETSSSVDYGSVVRQLLSGLLSTIAIFLLTLLFSMPIGLLVCEVRMSHFRVLQWIARIYISIMRGTPLMLQLLVVFFAPYYVFGVSMPASYRFYAVIIGFSLNYAAYFAEIYRSGIQSIPAGQKEAAQIMGYSRSQTFFRIIFPQMVKRVLPPVTNEIITLVKDTSLAFALAYTEMFTVAKQIAAAQTTILPLFVAGLFYYIFNFVVAFAMEKFEKKLDYYR
jgi:polar amino acid transport system substrate-binding protein